MKKNVICCLLFVLSKICCGQIEDSIPLFIGNVWVKSSSNLCLINERFRVELDVVHSTKDTVAITLQFTNLSNQLICIDTSLFVSFHKKSRGIYLSGNLFHGAASDEYYVLKGIMPNNQFRFSAKVAVPKFKKFALEFSCLPNAAFLMEKKVLRRVTVASSENVYYPLKEYPNYGYINIIKLTFDKNSKKISVFMPHGCHLCE